MNYRLFKTINDLSGNSAVDASMKFSARYLIFVLGALALAVCVWRLRRRSFRPVLLTAIALAVTFAAGVVAAGVYAERRPFQSHRVHQLVAHSPGQSFPSDHATAAFGIALSVAAFLSLRWGLALFLGAVVIGFARIYDGIHYPLDILGGLLAAVVGVGITAVAAWWVTRRQQGRPTAPTATSG